MVEENFEIRLSEKLHIDSILQLANNHYFTIRTVSVLSVNGLGSLNERFRFYQQTVSVLAANCLGSINERLGFSKRTVSVLDANGLCSINERFRCQQIVWLAKSIIMPEMYTITSKISCIFLIFVSFSILLNLEVS